MLCSQVSPASMANLSHLYHTALSLALALSHYVTLAGLELAVYPLSSNSQICCLCLPNAQIKEVCSHLIPAVGRQRQVDLSLNPAWSSEQVQDNQFYAEKPCLNTTPNSLPEKACCLRPASLWLGDSLTQPACAGLKLRM